MSDLEPTFVYSPQYYCDIGPHVFPMLKFERIYQALLNDGDISLNHFLLPKPASPETVAQVHTKEYIEDMVNLRATPRTIPTELPISEEIIRSYFCAAGGTLLACESALTNRLSMNIGGGFHHAFPDHGEGFCYINDIAVALRTLQAKKQLSRAAVVDCDVHQGNGTAYIFRDDPSVFTFSIHQQNNFPVKQRSDLDIGLPDGAGDDEYLAGLNRALERILDSSNPELVIYVAGADPFREDQLGGLALTLDGLRARDECVIGQCLKHDIAVVIVLAGGYAANIDDTVRIHHTTARLIWQVAKEN